MARLTARSAAFAPIILLALCAGQAACLAAPPGAGNAAAQVPETRGRIEGVTVYRGQALVTRVIEVPAGAGVRDIIVTDLPPAIEPASLHAEGDNPGVGVRSVLFRTQPVAVDVRDEVRQADGRLEAIAQEITATQRREALLGEHTAYINSLQGFVAPTATTELSKGVLNADTLTKLSDYIYKEREKIATNQLELQIKLKKLQVDLDLAQREKARLTAGTSRTVNQALISVAAPDGKPATIRLRYLVDEATWSPSYAVRAPGGAESERKSVTLEYFASVSQMSGEDWSGVQMTLSTATPSLVAKAPSLAPMTVRLASVADAAGANKQWADKGYEQAQTELRQQLKKVEEVRNRADNLQWASNAPAVAGQPKDDEQLRLGLEADRALNTLAGDMQLLDLVTAKRVGGRSKEPAASPSTEGLAVTYSITGATTLQSRADRQLIQITSVQLPAEFTKIATPVLTEYVYDQASLTNTSSTLLLAGPVTAYSGGAFVGSGEIASVAAGQSFVVGLGIDSTLRTRRELIERTENVQGGNRIIEATYRLVVENFAGQPCKVRVMDRIPRSADGQIMVSLVSSTPEPVRETQFVLPRLAPQANSNGVDGALQAPDRALPKDGILRWDLDAVPSAGAAPSTVEYKLRLEHDKQMSLVGMKG